MSIPAIAVARACPGRRGCIDGTAHETGPAGMGCGDTQVGSSKEEV